ncbi:chitinase-3-like protein 1 [Trachinotus anak]|uniref:chitinase-3-like protein 1 n=1 Tax=Trachinotus anak TaxID=443729 RepID=UPI0039F22E6E
MCKLLLTAGLCLITASLASSSRLVCYYNSTAGYRAEEGNFRISDIDPNKCTHLIFAFADIARGNILAPKKTSDLSLYLSFNALKTRNPELKTLLAVGDTDRFSRMVARRRRRTNFIESAITLLRTNGFDGLSLDWWFPAENRKQKFTQLIKELRDAFVAEGTSTNNDRLILIASVSAEKAVIDASYEVAEIAGNLDFINVLTFDFRGPSETVAGHHSPLYMGSQDTGDKIHSNTDDALQYWRDQGAPANKLNLGIASYGRVYTLTGAQSGVGAPVSGAGREGTYTHMKGLWAYYEICHYLDGVQVQLITDQKVPYAVVDNQWVGFDNKYSLEAKVNYINTNHFGGVFVWSLDLDDFGGLFCNNGKYPLISHLYHLLFSDNFCSGRRDGLHVNPDNPHSFFSCAHGITYVQYCPANLIFSTYCTCCDYPNRVAP